MYPATTRILATHLDEIHAACDRTLDAMNRAEQSTDLPQPHREQIRSAASDLRGHLDAISHVNLADFDAARRGFAGHIPADVPFSVR